jgi:hypothetical protein
MMHVLIMIVIFLVIMFITAGISSSIAKYMLKKKIIPGLEYLSDYV